MPHPSLGGSGLKLVPCSDDFTGYAWPKWNK